MRDGPTVLVDADACPVKDEVFRVAGRFKVRSVVVANQWMRLPESPFIERVVVSDGFDAADDWIAEAAGPRAIVITSDILLAERCLKAEACVLAPNGRSFTADSIGAAIATRAIMADLRGSGDQVGGGPPPFSKADRSAFLQSLDKELTRLTRA